MPQLVVAGAPDMRGPVVTVDLVDNIYVAGFDTDNVIAIAVKNGSPGDFMAQGSGYARHTLGGMTRKIYLFVRSCH